MDTVPKLGGLGKIWVLEAVGGTRFPGIGEGPTVISALTGLTVAGINNTNNIVMPKINLTFFTYCNNRIQSLSDFARKLLKIYTG